MLPPTIEPLNVAVPLVSIPKFLLIIEPLVKSINVPDVE
jgi:hypothetical protein